MPSAEELLRGVTVEILDRPNAAQSRLQAGETTSARGHVRGAHQFLDVKITVRAEQYFEEGELSTTRMSGAMFDQTKEERKAGFDSESNRPGAQPRAARAGRRPGAPDVFLTAYERA